MPRNLLVLVSLLSLLAFSLAQTEVIARGNLGNRSKQERSYNYKTNTLWRKSKALQDAYYSSAAYDSTDGLTQARDFRICSSTEPNCPNRDAEVSWIVWDSYQFLGYTYAEDMKVVLGFSDAQEQIFVSFQGTNNLVNLEEDFNGSQCDFHGYSVHCGFLHTWKNLATKVVECLEKLINDHPNYDITFTGHSLGGALAILAAYDVSQSIWLDYGIYVQTFGSPRVGSKSFADAVSSNSKIVALYRNVNWYDLVPHHPLTSLGYHHAATEMWLHDGGVWQCNDSGEDARCLLSVGGDSSFHGIKHYITTLTNL